MTFIISVISFQVFRRKLESDLNSSDPENQVEYIRTIGEFYIEEEEGDEEEHLVTITDTEVKRVFSSEVQIWRHGSETAYILRTAPEGCLRFDGENLLLKPGQVTKGDGSCKLHD